MPKIFTDGAGAWGIMSDAGEVMREGLTNSQAWRELDRIQNEPTSAAQVEKELAEPKPRPTTDEMQDFYSGLIHIQKLREYREGWAWHKFCEKFGHRPNGLHNEPRNPSKQVWGWVNRKAIAKEKGPKHVRG